ncbi:MAG: hypothetical protein A3G84_01130 [Chloroflexi bacterium RIFCSPLOWO2_12_FULL_71_12]|nr:MAG: hypothetical protein A2082_05665 [Chloroflexi bacterium GWC2_70_10]OGO68919.1 MAG: hypothetical protein A3H36_04390 [Chloroflexi bacterium RIFCSPLOWO2_02_FULL_71_16]OGO74164.1 MAG: hypothetical protein A3G84_01130 [Chloroflexi bacterium RIFCSPLOWO2_12_FULL_71_12]
MMSMIQVESVSPPLNSPEVASLAVRILSVAEAMGLLPGRDPIRQLDRGVLERIAKNAATSAGIGRDVLADLRRADRADRMEPAVRRLYEALERSPAPATEWRSLVAVIGTDLLAQLLGTSGSSLRRYLAGTRRTPDVVADRLHFIALVVADLAGSYNDLGLRRWFERPRVLLGGKSPAQLLKGEWRVDDAGPARVRELAYALTAPLGT